MESKTVSSAKKQAVYERNYRRARERALSRLRQNHPSEYRELFEEERRRDEQEGKTWIDIDLVTGSPVRISSAHRDSSATNPRAEQETGSNL